MQGMTAREEKSRILMEQSCFRESLSSYWCLEMREALKVSKFAYLVDVHQGLAHIFERTIPQATYCARLQEVLSFFLIDITLREDLPHNIPLQKIRIYLQFYSLLLTLRSNPLAPVLAPIAKIKQLISEYWLLRTFSLSLQGEQYEKNYHEFFLSIFKVLASYTFTPPFVKCLAHILTQFIYEEEYRYELTSIFQPHTPPIPSTPQTTKSTDPLGRTKKRILEDEMKTPDRKISLEIKEKMSYYTADTNSTEIQNQRFRQESFKFMEEKSKIGRTLVAGHPNKWMFRKKDVIRQKRRIIYFCSEQDE